MTRYVFKMPDLGEGTVEAEIVAWHVKVGDLVDEDQVMAEVMTEKAAVEVPAPVTGRVVSLTGEPGDMVRGRRRADRVRDRDADERARHAVPAAAPAAVAAAPLHASRRRRLQLAAAARRRPSRAGAAEAADGRVMASPATRRRAREAGIDLAQVHGSRPERAHHAAGPRGGAERRRRAAAPTRRRAAAHRRPRAAHRHRGDQGHRRAPRDRATA